MAKLTKIIDIYKTTPKIINLLKKKKEIIITALTLAILADSIVPYQSSDFIIFPILFLYCMAIRVFSITSKFTFSLCLGLLIVMCIEFYITYASVTTEKAAVWFILSLGIGAVQQWSE